MRLHTIMPDVIHLLNKLLREFSDHLMGFLIKKAIRTVFGATEYEQ